MSFCSLEEAWGENYANLYKKKEDSMLTAMPMEESSNALVLKDRDLTQVSKPIDRNMIDEDIEKYYMNKKDEIKENYSCGKFLEHFLDCESCKKKVNQILDVKNDHSVVEKFGTSLMGGMDDNYLDIFVLILTGIFIIFILDCFVRLGRNFKR